MRRPAPWDATRPGRGHFRPKAPRAVVVGYDGSQAARRALQRAAEAAGSGGHVEILACSKKRPPCSRDRDVRVSTRVEEAEPAEALAAAARDLDAVLIVVGARGDSYFARALRGSVGEKLVARAPCDLLIAPYGSRGAKDRPAVLYYWYGFFS